MLINRLRFDRAYGRLRDEEGLSLIEMMVALILVGVVLSALASTIVASLRGITKNQREARAIALQTEMVERFQSIPWGEVGVYRHGSSVGDVDGDGDSDNGEHPWDDPDDNPNPNDPPLDDVLDRPIVDLGERPDSALARFIPEAVEMRGEGDFEYRIESHVVWVSRDDEPDPSDIQDFESKRIVVFVRWVDVNGAERVVEIAAERSPPPMAIGFVDAANDADGDNIANDNDNCRLTPNSDQTNSSTPQPELDHWTPPGVGDACDRDGDGYPEEDRDGSGTIEHPEDPCPSVAGTECTAETEKPVINSFQVNKQSGETSGGDPVYSTQNRICVSNNDATSADHRVLVNMSNNEGGTVTVEYWYWKGSENTSPPGNSEQIQATDPDGDGLWVAILPQNTGKFRPDLSTGLEVTATNSFGEADPKDNKFTLAIDLC